MRDYKLATTSTETDLPEEFKLEYLPEIKNQGPVNSCVAHVSASIEEYFEKKQCNADKKLSVGFIYGTRYNYTGEGMYLRDALKTLSDKGICTYERFPYNREVPEIFDLIEEANISEKDTSHCRITEYFRLYSNDEIKKSLMKYGPVMMSVAWYKDNKVSDGKLIQGTNLSGYHCLYLYGWNKDGFLFMNSWGKDWANKGTCVLPYSYKIVEAYGIRDENISPDNEDIIYPKRNKFLDVCYKIINSIVNFLARLVSNK